MMPSEPTRPGQAARWLLPAVLVLSGGLNLWNNHFPLGYHFDERKKVDFILTGEQDFRHPLLMLQTVRAVNRVLQLTDRQQIAVLGRATMAVFGMVTVFGAYLLARPSLGRRWALLVAAAVAVSPMMVVHAHYLKEDVVLTCFLILSLGALMWFLDRPAWERVLVLGVVTGLAGAAHYKAVLLLPLYAVAPMFVPAGRRRACYEGGLVAAAVSVVVFLLVNWPILVDPDTFLEGMSYEARHAVEGHDVPISPWPYLFAFHLLYSLVPGMTMVPLTLGLAGLGWAVARWRHITWREQLLVIYVALFYFVPESSLLKPFPNFERYMVPVVPALLYFAAFFLQRLKSAFPKLGGLIWVAALAMIAIPLQDTLRLGYFMNRDTRAMAAQWLAEVGGDAVYEWHSGEHFDVRSAAELDIDRLQAQGTAFIVVSSFTYERYFLAERLAGQSDEVRSLREGYVRLFRFPYTEIRPRHRSFAFSNPVIRIIDIRPGQQTGAAPH